MSRSFLPERLSARYGRAMPANRTSGMTMKITLDPSMAPGLLPESCRASRAAMSSRACGRPRVQRGSEPLAELVPAGLKGANALVFEDLHHVVVVDADRGEFAERVSLT